VRGERQPHGLALDGDAALALDVHPVQVLRPHLPLPHHAGELEHPVRQRGLAVVDVRDDAEVPDDLQWGIPVRRRPPAGGRGPPAVRGGLLGQW
jgi:hypothetical protein